jgi:hypothetical protein
LRQAAEEKLIKWYKEDKLRTIEASETEVYEDGLKLKRQYRKPEEIFRLLRSVREQYPNKKIVVFLDAWNNLDMSGHKSSSDISQANHYLGKLQEEVNELGIMFMISAHLRKMERKARPTLDDIKGTSDMQYHVVWAGIVVNELKERTLKDPLVHRVQDTLYPVLVIENVKNKVSTVDGDLMYVLNSGRCGLTPLHHVEYVEYRGIYRGARR